MTTSKLNEHKFDELANVDTELEHIFKKGTVLKQQYETTENEKLQEQLKKEMNRLASVVLDWRELKQNAISAEIYQRKISLAGVDNEMLNEIGTLLKTELEPKFTNSDVVVFALRYFFINVIIPFKLREDKDEPLSDFMKENSAQVQENPLDLQTDILERVKHIDRNNFRIYQMLLNMFFFNQDDEDQKGVEKVAPYNDNNSVLHSIHKSFEKQADKYFKNEEATKKLHESHNI
jgi:hypothetical protein